MGIKISKIDNSMTKPRLITGSGYKSGVTTCSVYKSRVNYNNNAVVGRENTNDCISFKGNIVDKVLKSDTAHKVIYRAYRNPLLSEAIFALLITCGLRPATIMATAGKDEENRKKCKMQVAKSFATGLVGLCTTFVISNPISHAINKFAGSGGKNVQLPDNLAEQVETLIKPANQFLKDNADKLEGFAVKNLKGETLETTIENIVMTKGAKEGLEEFSKEVFDKVADAITAQKSINKYRTTMTSLLKKVICPVFSPAKAAVTIALVPVMLGLIFNNKNKDKADSKEQKTADNSTPNPNITQSISSKGSLIMPSDKIPQVKGGLN